MFSSGSYDFECVLPAIFLELVILLILNQPSGKVALVLSALLSVLLWYPLPVLVTKYGPIHRFMRRHGHEKTTTKTPVRNHRKLKNHSPSDPYCTFDDLFLPRQSPRPRPTRPKLQTLLLTKTHKPRYRKNSNRPRCA